ncbi:MAG: hypothetical protein IPN95_29295 [Bacteroidetes bacterium]|nr:hypothetical protein [Bacteroidota bacterium]
MTHTKFRTALIAIVFLAMIFFPMVNENLRLVKDIESAENRALAEKPVFDVSLLDPFPRKYEAYYNDHFSLRFQLVDFYSQLQFRFFKVSPIPELALLGKEDWFFFAGDEQDSYLGNHRITPAELDSFRLELEYRREFIRQQGGEMYFFVAPVKNNIYTEYQPSTAYPLFPDCWGEQILNHLAQKSTIKTINVYDTLRAWRKDQLLYFKRDNHWTPYGAFLAANVVLNRIHQDFPAVVANRPEDFRFQPSKKVVGNVAAMFGIKNLMIDTVVAFVPKAGFKANDAAKVPYEPLEGFSYPWDYEQVKETGDTSKPKMVLICDSFGHNIFPHLAEQFGRSVKIFDAWQYMLNPEIIINEKPDVVIFMPMEANLRHLLDNQARLGDK